jgi:hypothetical protein
MDNVIQTWERAFSAVQRQAEAISCIAHGKAVRHPRTSDDHRNGGFANGLGTRRPSYQSAVRKPSVSPARNPRPPSPVLGMKPRINGFQSANPSHSPPITNAANLESPDPSGYHTPPAYAPAAPRADYFSRERQASATPSTIASLAAAAAKKKPPPPPPRTGSSNQSSFVTALYDFSGQQLGDLAFREGDRIRILKKTDSRDDWWEGELRGVKGSFPANYCQ